MEISPHIISGLHSGQDAGAKVAATLPDHTASIQVSALIDSTKGRLTRANSQRRLQIDSFNGDDPVNGYLVRHMEVPNKYLMYPDDYDLHASIYDEYEVETIQQLGTVLSKVDQ